MTMISGEEITKIRESVNIIDIINSYLPLTQKGKNYFCVCPFHDDHAPSMSISAEKQIYKCFSCGASGNVFTFIQNYEKVSFPEAVQKVAKIAGIAITTNIIVKNDNKFKTEYEIMDLTNKYYQNYLKTEAGSKAREYLASRGITEEIISEFGIGLSPANKDDLTSFLKSKQYDETVLVDLGLSYKTTAAIVDNFSKRIMFPIYDDKANVVAFTARIYNNEETAKYINNKETKIFTKGHILYNYHNALKFVRGNNFLIIVEGNMDAIRLSSCGIKNVVALMGTSLTKEQIILIRSLKCPVILLLDSDEAGLAATDTNGGYLTRARINVSVVSLTAAKDPDEYILKNGVDSLKLLLDNPLKYFDFKMNYLKSNLNMENPDDIAKYVNSVMAYLNTINDEVLKEATINKLQKDFNLSENVLRKKLVSKEEKKEFIEKPKEKKIKNKYEVSAMKILFFMMNDGTYIKMYQKKLGYMENPLYRSIANEIIYYYKVNNDISMADFITFVNDKDISDKVEQIIGTSSEEEINESNAEAYIEVLREEIIKKEIKELKESLKQELDMNKKIDLLARLTEIKKGSGRNE